MRAEKQLTHNSRPPGLSLSSECSVAEVEEYKAGNQVFKEGSLFAMNSADDTYVLGRRAKDTSYTLTVIRKEYAMAGQHLHASKSQCLSSEEPSATGSDMVR